VRRAAYAKRSEARRADAKPKPVAPPPTETVEQVVEAPAPPPVETATVGRAEPARPIQQVPPRVPSSTIRVRAEGTVVVEVTIDTRGNVSDVRIVKPVFPSYDAAALRAAKQWKFQPATINGEPVESRMTLQFAFKP
jgi:protein TonB